MDPSGLFNNISSEDLNGIVEAIDSILYTKDFLVIQSISFVVTVGLFILWIWLLRKTGILKRKISILREAFTEAPAHKGRFQNQWGSAVKRLSTEDEAQWKLAILEADAVFDNLLQSLGYRGATMGDRMKAIQPDQFPFLEDAWRAHKVRNFIAHDPRYRVEKETAERALEIYRRIFEYFNIV